MYFSNKYAKEVIEFCIVGRPRYEESLRGEVYVVCLVEVGMKGSVYGVGFCRRVVPPKDSVYSSRQLCFAHSAGLASLTRRLAGENNTCNRSAIKHLFFIRRRTEWQRPT